MVCEHVIEDAKSLLKEDGSAVVLLSLTCVSRQVRQLDILEIFHFASIVEIY
jgi:hypothetical protein